VRILGHIHTFNDDDVIDQTLSALLNQTLPLDEIVIVDNGSQDDTLNRTFLEKVHVIRHGENLGTSGAVHTGFQYALENNYDWIWLFDADSVPRKDALEKLLELYESFNPEIQEKTLMVGCPSLNMVTGKLKYGLVFTPHSYSAVDFEPGKKFFECDMNIWSGSLYKMEGVQKVGLPSVDYVLDWGENAYGYLTKQQGYRAFIHPENILDHNVRESKVSRFSSHRLGGLSFTLPILPPIRLYYIYRNYLYFWFYVYHKGNLARFLKQSFWMPKHLFKLLLAGKFAPEITTCLKGLRHGVFKKMHYRFKVK